MEQTIKEYLNINAPKYAEFKGYNEDFIKAVNDFTEGTEPTEQVQQFYDEAMDTVKKFQEGGNIPKGVSSADREKDLKASWRQEVFSKLQQELYNKLKLGLEGKEGGITMDQFNDYQSKHANIYNRIKGTDFYTNAYRPETEGEVSGLQKRYENHKFNDLAIKPNWETRYHINSSQPTSGDRIGQWTTDDLYSAITDDRRFGRDGDWEPEELEKFQNQLKELGYTYTLDKNDNYYKLGLLNPDVSKNNSKTHEVETKANLQSGIPTIGVTKNPLRALKNLNNWLPDIFETIKFFDSYNTNKRMKDLFQNNYKYATEEYRPKHLNIYGDLAALNQNYNEAANLQRKANILGNNTSDYRTASAINLQGQQQAEQVKAQGRKAYNDLARATSDRALQLEFDNIDKEQTVANENFGRGIAAHNVKMNNILEYMNQQHANRKDYLNYWETKVAQVNQDRKQFMAKMLESQMDKALENDPELLQAQKNYTEAKTREEKDSAYNNFIELKRRKSREILPIYYEQLASLKGFKYNPNNNPFIMYKKGGTISDDGPVRKRSKDLERHRKKRNDDLLNNNKKLDRLGRLTYLWAKRAQGKK